MSDTERLTPVKSWAHAPWARALFAVTAGYFAILAVGRFGAPAYIVTLAACLCLLIVSYMRFAKRLQRRREALLDSTAPSAAGDGYSKGTTS